MLVRVKVADFATPARFRTYLNVQSLLLISIDCLNFSRQSFPGCQQTLGYPLVSALLASQILLGATAYRPHLPVTTIPPGLARRLDLKTRKSMRRNTAEVRSPIPQTAPQNLAYYGS